MARESYQNETKRIKTTPFSRPIIRRVQSIIRCVHSIISDFLKEIEICLQHYNVFMNYIYVQLYI